VPSSYGVFKATGRRSAMTLPLLASDSPKAAPLFGDGRPRYVVSMSLLQRSCASCVMHFLPSSWFRSSMSPENNRSIRHPGLRHWWMHCYSTQEIRHSR